MKALLYIKISVNKFVFPKNTVHDSLCNNCIKEKVNTSIYTQTLEQHGFAQMWQPSIYSLVCYTGLSSTLAISVSLDKNHESRQKLEFLSCSPGTGNQKHAVWPNMLCDHSYLQEDFRVLCLIGNYLHKPKKTLHLGVNSPKFQPKMALENSKFCL